MLEAVIIGNLGADAVVKDFGGSKCISFDVAHTEKYTDRNGNPTESTTWVSVLKPCGQNDKLCQYLKKGTQVYVRGNASVRCYQGQSGWRAGMNVHCTQLQLLSASKQTAEPSQPAQPAQPAQPQQPAYQMPSTGDDLIF